MPEPQVRRLQGRRIATLGEHRVVQYDRAGHYCEWHLANVGWVLWDEIPADVYKRLLEALEESK